MSASKVSTPVVPTAEVDSLFDLDAFRAATLQSEPYRYLVVPNFIRPKALAAINHDYPQIDRPGNFELQNVRYGPAFATMLEYLESPVIEALFAEKFALDLSGHPTAMTVRRYAEMTDGNIHNDSRMKIITVLLYFNPDWPYEEGRLRILRSETDMDDYTAEVAPCGGTLLAFRRSANSYHGFVPCERERRSLQMHWLDPERAAAKRQNQNTWRKKIKRFLKGRV